MSHEDPRYEDELIREYYADEALSDDAMARLLAMKKAAPAPVEDVAQGDQRGPSGWWWAAGGLLAAALVLFVVSSAGGLAVIGGLLLGGERDIGTEPRPGARDGKSPASKSKGKSAKGKSKGGGYSGKGKSKGKGKAKMARPAPKPRGKPRPGGPISLDLELTPYDHGYTSVEVNCSDSGLRRRANIETNAAVQESRVTIRGLPREVCQITFRGQQTTETVVTAERARSCHFTADEVNCR